MISKAKTSLWILIILSLLAGAIWTVRTRAIQKLPLQKLSFWKKSKKMEPRTAPATRGDLEIRYKEVGELAAKVDIQVRPPVDGQVKKVVVDEGGRVARGAVLAVIQPGKTEAEQKLYVASEVRSPIDGVVLYCNTEEGDVVNAGKEDFIRVADLKNMVVYLEIGEMDVLKLKTGQSAAVTVDAIAGDSYKGKIHFISPGTTEKKSGGSYGGRQAKKFVVKVDLERSDPRLKPGMTARIDILLEKRPSVVKAPLGGIFEDMGAATVYVKGPNGVEERQVKTGLRNETEAEVLEGLKEGEILLLEKPEDMGSVKKAAAPKNPSAP